MKIIIIDKCVDKNTSKITGYKARVFGKTDDVFGKTEIVSLQNLLKFLKKKNDKFIIN